MIIPTAEKNVVAKPVCPNGHTPAFFVVPLYDIHSGLMEVKEYEGRLRPNGTVMYCYNDGTFGVTKDDFDQITESDVAFCSTCLCEVMWEH